MIDRKTTNRILIRQPDGNYALFSNVVDTFVKLNLTKAGIYKYDREHILKSKRGAQIDAEAWLRIRKANWNKFGWNECLEIIERKSAGDFYYFKDNYGFVEPTWWNKLFHRQDFKQKWWSRKRLT